VLQCIALRVAVYCIAFSFVFGLLERQAALSHDTEFERRVVRCRVLQCDAVCCSVLQCVAVCCSVLRGVVARFFCVWSIRMASSVVA